MPPWIVKFVLTGLIFLTTVSHSCLPAPILIPIPTVQGLRDAIDPTDETGTSGTWAQLPQLEPSIPTTRWDGNDNDNGNGTNVERKEFEPVALPRKGGAGRALLGASRSLGRPDEEMSFWTVLFMCLSIVGGCILCFKPCCCPKTDSDQQIDRSDEKDQLVNLVQK